MTAAPSADQPASTPTKLGSGPSREGAVGSGADQLPRAEPPAQDARMSTHWETCWTDGGPRHWDCAQKLIRDQTAWIEHQARELADARAALSETMIWIGVRQKEMPTPLLLRIRAILDAAKGAK